MNIPKTSRLPIMLSFLNLSIEKLIKDYGKI